MNSNGAKVFFFLPFYAQAVLFLCTTSNLNLLCKDGYIFFFSFFFCFFCQKPKYRMLVYICYSVNLVKFQCTCIVLASLILSISCKKKNAFTVSFCVITFNFVSKNLFFFSLVLFLPSCCYL